MDFGVCHLPTVSQKEQAVSATGFAYSTVPFSVPAESMCFVPTVVPSGLVPAGFSRFVEALGAGYRSLLSELLIRSS